MSLTKTPHFFDGLQVVLLYKKELLIIKYSIMKRVRINVGKVVKSVGLGTYKEINKIKTANAIETVSNISSIADGRGTIIIARIAITNRTTLKSLCPRRKFKLIPICCLSVNFFAKR